MPKAGHGEADVGDPSINVETGELRRFAKDVGSDTDDVLSPEVGRATMPLQDGVTFGATNASGAVHAAKTRYADSLRVSMSNLTAFVEAARIMAAAAEMVAADYDETDARAADRAARVSNILQTATKQAQDARALADRQAHNTGGTRGAV
jgi:hypothetical protein